MPGEERRPYDKEYSSVYSPDTVRANLRACITKQREIRGHEERRGEGDHLRSGGFPAGSRGTTETLFFIWAASFIPILSIAVYLTAHYRVPILTILLFLAIGFSSCNDNHEVRELPKNAANPTDRVTVAEAAANWWRTINQSEPGQAGAAPAKRQPLIIVATAGGGSRAAYWTATALGRLQDCYPQFARYTFAKSAECQAARSAPQPFGPY